MIHINTKECNNANAKSIFGSWFIVQTKGAELKKTSLILGWGRDLGHRLGL